MIYSSLLFFIRPRIFTYIQHREHRNDSRGSLHITTKLRVRNEPQHIKCIYRKQVDKNYSVQYHGVPTATKFTTAEMWIRFLMYILDRTTTNR